MAEFDYSGYPVRDRNTYVYGTAVPKPSYPQREETPQPKQRPRRRVVKVEKIHPMVLASWIVASLVLVAACGFLLSGEMKLNNYLDTVSGLEAQIEEKKSENDFAYARISESINYEAIQQEAERLGMVKLTPDKIIDIQYAGSDYVKQYKNVPDAGASSSDLLNGR